MPIPRRQSVARIIADHAFAPCEPGSPARRRRGRRRRRRRAGGLAARELALQGRSGHLQKLGRALLPRSWCTVVSRLIRSSSTTRTCRGSVIGSLRQSAGHAWARRVAPVFLGPVRSPVSLRRRAPALPGVQFPWKGFSAPPLKCVSTASAPMSASSCKNIGSLRRAGDGEAGRCRSRRQETASYKARAPPMPARCSGRCTNPVAPAAAAISTPATANQRKRTSHAARPAHAGARPHRCRATASSSGRAAVRRGAGPRRATAPRRSGARAPWAA